MNLRSFQLYCAVCVLTVIFAGSALYLLFEKPEDSLISEQVLEPPTATHPLGTTDLGEDIFVQLIQGAMPTLAVGLVVGGCCVLFGFFTAALAVLGGKVPDRIVLRSVDIMSAIPSTVAIMLIMSVLRPGLGSLILILILFDWHVDVRTFRAKIKQESANEAVIMAKIFGAEKYYLVWRHLLPACYPLLIARLLQTARRAIFKMAGLAFLGVTDPDMPSWGAMLNQSMPYLTTQYWQYRTLPPALMLFLTLSSLLLINNYVEQRWFLSGSRI